MNLSSEKLEISHLFNNIASHYDFLNHFLSFGIDKYWRRKMIHIISHISETKILDVACGTGDCSIEAVKQGAKQVIGIDISDEMLKIATHKAEKKLLSNKLQFISGSALQIPFDNQSFDVVMVAFGVRNFANLEKGLKEIYRVLRKNGIVVILEFSMPTNVFFGWIYRIYFYHILPFFGGVISGNKKAYQYLAQSVTAFPQRDEFLKILSNCGFQSVKKIKLSCGIAHLYLGTVAL